MRNAPLVSICISAYNAERFLPETLDSLLAQTLRDFELIVVNDGSSDGTQEVLERYQARDRRIRVISNGRLGYTGAANAACQHARGRYIARSDADDISLPGRLVRQVAFLEANPEVAMTGTWAVIFGLKRGELRFPTDSDSLKVAPLFYNPFLHSSGMWRSRLFHEDGVSYDARFSEASDYQLWVDVARRHPVANMPEFLLRYRVTSTSVTLSSAMKQRATAKEIRRLQLVALGVEPDARELEVHQSLGTWDMG
ncbi:MAG: glycosyltransferase family 2 protein, partial [Myxococcaceae bacterium]|nr:glycosyltransferase family 2 protein [Myxococcaceae bacterium]